MNISVHTMAGRELPRDWRAQAANNRASFDEELRHRLENKWRTSLTTTNDSPIIGARLRQDSRMDGLRLVVDDDEQEVWQAAGVRVIRRKSNGK